MSSPAEPTSAATSIGRRAAPDAGALSAALRALGLPCAVEVIGAMAVLVPAPGAASECARQRPALLAAARAAGFSHAALELPDDDSIDDSATGQGQ